LSFVHHFQCAAFLSCWHVAWQILEQGRAIEPAKDLGLFGLCFEDIISKTPLKNCCF
jgi:hypothetical protein